MHDLLGRTGGKLDGLRHRPCVVEEKRARLGVGVGVVRQVMLKLVYEGQVHKIVDDKIWRWNASGGAPAVRE